MAKPPSERCVPNQNSLIVDETLRHLKCLVEGGKVFNVGSAVANMIAHLGRDQPIGILIPQQFLQNSLHLLAMTMAVVTHAALFPTPLRRG